MKAPWRCQVEQTPHRQAFNGGGVVFKGRFYNQVVWKCTNFGEVQFPGIIVFFPIFLLSQKGKTQNDNGIQLLEWVESLKKTG